LIYNNVLAALRRERQSMLADLTRLDEAISALQTVVGRRITVKPKAQATRSARTPQGAARRLKENTGGKPRPRISAQGRRNIVEGQRRRWAKVRAAARTQAASPRKGSSKWRARITIAAFHRDWCRAAPVRQILSEFLCV